MLVAQPPSIDGAKGICVLRFNFKEDNSWLIITMGENAVLE